MVLFEWVIALLSGAVLLAGLARRVGAPYPAFLAIGGALLAFAPGGPRLTLDPALALALFVAPALLDAAFDASLRDLRDNWAPLLGLIVIAVVLTSVSVALVAHALRPEMALPVALAMGATVAPPDAAAATTVLRQVRIPHRLRVILEGESMLNDAVALLLYRASVGAAMVAGFSVTRALPLAIVAIVGSVIAGVVLARITLPVTRRVADVPSSIVVQFVLTFGVWIVAERVGLSGVLTIVAYAITLARSADSMPARVRVPSFAVWDTAVFVLNVLAFVLVGLQIGPIVERLSPPERVRDFAFVGAILGVVVAVRFAWVMFFNAVVRWRVRRFGVHQPRPMLRPTVRGGLLISWCGMRGIVTLAAALALPDRFPQRDLVALTAFGIVVGTLLVQGLTLGPLVRLLDVHDDGAVDREVRLGWIRGLESALRSLNDEVAPEAAALRQEYAAALTTATRAADGEPAATSFPSDALRRGAVAAARAAVSDLRRRGEIGDEAFHALEEELDRRELGAQV